jgi:hypothetical protein
VILIYVFIRVVGVHFQDKPMNISDEINAALRAAPADNIVDMRTLTGNRGWDTLHIILPGTDVSDYLRNFRRTVYVSGHPVSGRLRWGGEQEDISIENNPELVLLIFSSRFEVSAYANVVQKYSVVPFAQIVKETGKSVYDYPEAVFELNSKN